MLVSRTVGFSIRCATQRLALYARFMTKPTGRPSKYKPEFAEQVYRLALLGTTDPEIGVFFDVSIGAIDRWKVRHPEFRSAIMRGRMNADANVAHKLYRRACGYSHEAVKIFMPQGAAEPVYAPYVEHYPPDTNAASLWLRNRQPALWRDRIEHSGPGGEALQIQIVRYAEPQPKVIEHEAQAVDSSALVAPAAVAAEEAPIYIDSSTDAARASGGETVVEIRRFADERKSQR
ncbi:MAG TPA: hypothetical protein VGR45_02645 [Stellaceae bacterium]|nr:hypothetical protein [Stellaceae bacterium]